MSILTPIPYLLYFLITLTIYCEARSGDSARCLPTNDPTYPHKINLEGDGSHFGDITFHFKLEEDTLSAQILYRGIGWVGWAVSPTGEMIGAEAIIGLASNAAQVAKYRISGKSLNGVALLPPEFQTLEGDISQNDGMTVLSFRKPLEEGQGQHTIQKEGLNTFLWAVGSDNTLRAHKKRSKFMVDFSKCATDIATDIPTEDSSEDDEELTATHMDAAEDSGSNTTEKSLNVNTAAYDNILTLQGRGRDSSLDSVSFLYTLTQSNKALSIQIIYEGLGWIGWGISPNGGHMLQSQAVIGLPGEPSGPTNPGKYHLVKKDVSGVTLASGEHPLYYTSIEQSDNATVLTFTKPLSEYNEYDILPCGVNTFIWAVGYTNTLGVHKYRGSFELDLQHCDDSKTAAVLNSYKSMSSKSSNNKIGAFIAHGLVAAVAWSIVAPFSIATAWFRNLMYNQWIYLHVFGNLCCLFLTLIAMLIVFVAISLSEDGLHLSNSHHVLGLVMAVLMIVQFTGGIFRPPSEMHFSYGLSRQSSEGSVNSSFAFLPRTKRQFWKLFHRTLGTSLLLMSVFQIKSGLELYSANFGTKSMVPLYYTTVAVFVLSVLVIKLSFVYQGRKSVREQSDESMDISVFTDGSARAIC